MNGFLDGDCPVSGQKRLKEAAIQIGERLVTPKEASDLLRLSARSICECEGETRPDYGARGACNVPVKSSADTGAFTEQPIDGLHGAGPPDTQKHCDASAGLQKALS